MEVTGRIKEIFDIEEKGGNGFKVRKFVVVTQEQYPQELLLQTTGDKTSLLEKSKVGDLVRVSINLRGRCWVNPEGKNVYFNSIDAWNIQADTLSNPGDSQAPNLPPIESFVGGESSDDDLPF